MAERLVPNEQSKLSQLRESLHTNPSVIFIGERPGTDVREYEYNKTISIPHWLFVAPAKAIRFDVKNTSEDDLIDDYKDGLPIPYDTGKVNDFMHSIVPFTPDSKERTMYYIEDTQWPESRGDFCHTGEPKLRSIALQYGILYFHEPIGKRKHTNATSTEITRTDEDTPLPDGIKTGETTESSEYTIIRNTVVRVYPDPIVAKIAHGKTGSKRTLEGLQGHINHAQLEILMSPPDNEVDLANVLSNAQDKQRYTLIN